MQEMWGNHVGEDGADHVGEDGADPQGVPLGQGGQEVVGGGRRLVSSPFYLGDMDPKSEENKTLVEGTLYRVHTQACRIQLGWERDKKLDKEIQEWKDEILRRLESKTL